MGEIIDFQEFADKKLEKEVLEMQGLDPKKYGVIIVRRNQLCRNHKEWLKAQTEVICHQI